MSDQTDEYKVVWTDGYNRDHIAERVISEHMDQSAADALCNKLRAEAIGESDWWVVKRQDAPLWRGMEELI